MFWSIIGTTAACLTMLSFIPQIHKIIKTRSAHDVSIITLLQLSLGVSLWIAYGVHLRDPIIIGANAVTLLTLVITLGLYYKYHNNKYR